jgi:hypothetical protein
MTPVYKRNEDISCLRLRDHCDQAGNCEVIKILAYLYLIVFIPREMRIGYWWESEKERDN